jgi:nucleoside phosphorylase
LINFNLQNSDWGDKLKSKVFYLQSFKKRYKEFIDRERKYDIAVVTALNSEFEQLKSTWSLKPLSIANDPITYFETILNTKNNNNLKVVACCINQMGMQASAAMTSKILSRFTPTFVFITGICGGIKSSGVNIGDIVIASQCWDYESGKITEDDGGKLLFNPDMKCLTTEHGILSKLTEYSNSKKILSKIYNEFHGAKPNTQLTVGFGSVGSGPYVLSSTKYLDQLLKIDRKLTAIDMEGFGVYKATQFYSGTSAVFIKGISDLGDMQKNNHYQEYASYVSSKFLFDFLYDAF